MCKTISDTSFAKFLFSSDRTNFVSASCIVAMDVSISDKRKGIKINWPSFYALFYSRISSAEVCGYHVFLIDEGS